MPKRTDAELIAALHNAPFPKICEHGRRDKSCIDCENKRLGARVETLEVLEREYSTKVQDWNASLERLAKLAEEAEQQAHATVHALLVEVRELKRRLAAASVVVADALKREN